MNGLRITDVRVVLANVGVDGPGKVLAFVSFMFNDCIAVHNVKVVQGNNGIIVSMPSRKVTAHCPNCGINNNLNAYYCNGCAINLGKPRRPPITISGQQRYHQDILHPTCQASRRLIDTAILAAYDAEVEASSQPGYQSPSLCTSDRQPLRLAREIG